MIGPELRCTPPAFEARPTSKPWKRTVSWARCSHLRMTGEQSSGSGGFGPRLSRLHELPDARGGERQLARLDAEIAQSICDGIGHDAARGNDAALAGSLGPEGIDRGRVLLEDDGADIGKITGGGNEIIGERAREQLALLIVLQMLHDRPAEALHYRADGLPVHGARVDDAPAVLDHDVIYQIDMTKLGIHSDVGGVRPVGIGVLLVEESAFRRDAIGS